MPFRSAGKWAEIADHTLNWFSGLAHGNRFYNSSVARGAREISSAVAHDFGNAGRRLATSRAATQMALVGTVGGLGGYGYSKATGDRRAGRDISLGIAAGMMGGAINSTRGAFSGGRMRGVMGGFWGRAKSGVSSLRNDLRSAAASSRRSRGSIITPPPSAPTRASLLLPRYASTTGSWGPLASPQRIRTYASGVKSIF